MTPDQIISFLALIFYELNKFHSSEHIESGLSLVNGLLGRQLIWDVFGLEAGKCNQISVHNNQLKSSGLVCVCTEETGEQLKFSIKQGIDVCNSL